MRTFNVNVKGAIHVVRAEDFLHPLPAVGTAKQWWCFLSAEGQVLWSWSAEDVRSVTEEITIQVR